MTPLDGSRYWKVLDAFVKHLVCTFGPTFPSLSQINSWHPRVHEETVRESDFAKLSRGDISWAPWSATDGGRWAGASGERRGRLLRLGLRGTGRRRCSGPRAEGTLSAAPSTSTPSLPGCAAPSRHLFGGGPCRGGGFSFLTPSLHFGD